VISDACVGVGLDRVPPELRERGPAVNESRMIRRDLRERISTLIKGELQYPRKFARPILWDIWEHGFREARRQCHWRFIWHTAILADERDSRHDRFQHRNSD
jgi:hypothetical protein